MQIKRATASFRSGTSVPGTRGAHEGDLVPESHPLVSRFPQHFENVEDYVERKFPQLYGRARQPRRGLLGRAKAKQPVKNPVREPNIEQPAPPARPPTSGRGSGHAAWRQYAAQVTGTPVESWADLKRDQIVELLDRPEGDEHVQA